MSSEKFKDKYRIESVRLEHWDYGWEASYFITICTKGKINYFGHILNEKMILSEIGEIVKKEWKKTFEMRHDMNLMIDEFIIMPNHFHAIIHIGKNPYNSQNETSLFSSGGSFGPQRKNLSSIIRGFKIGVTTNARLLHSNFTWQSRFHDHIIRNKKSYQKISEYIVNNPHLWKQDKFYRPSL